MFLSGSRTNPHFLRPAQAENAHALPAFRCVDKYLLPAGAGRVRRLDVDFLPVLPRLKPHELAAGVGHLNERFSALYIALDTDTARSRLMILRPTPP